MRFPSEKAVEALRKQYPVGARVELVHMDDQYSNLKPGDRGYVEHIDDAGGLHVRWDSGSGLALDFFEDSYRLVTAEELEAEKTKAEQTQAENEDEDELEL